MTDPDNPSESEQPQESPDTASVVHGLLDRMRLERLEQRYNTRLIQSLFTFVNGALSIGLLALVAQYAHAPFIFPSLGPTAFLLFYRPMAEASSPRNTLAGHLIGAVAGWASLAAFGLIDAPSALAVGVDGARAAAAAVSLGATGGLMVLLRVPHPPAGATTLIISLGLMPRLAQMPVLMLAVFLLIVQGFAINRLAGLDYPLWKAKSD